MTDENEPYMYIIEEDEAESNHSASEEELYDDNVSYVYCDDDLVFEEEPEDEQPKDFVTFDKALAQDWYEPSENIIEYGAISKTRVVHLRNVLQKRYRQELVDEPIFSTKRVALIVCNSYDSDKRPLGRSVYNDTMLTYDRLNMRDYETYIVHNVTKDEFQTVLRNALQQHLDKLVFYYIGHGVWTQKKNSLDGYSSFVCCDIPKAPGNCRNFLSSSTVHLLIRQFNTCEKLVLIADCCHSRSIFGISNTVDSVSVVTACNDDERAKQDEIMEAVPKQEHGLFTYYFWNYIDECENDPNKLFAKIKPILKRKGQRCSIVSSEEQLL